MKKYCKNLKILSLPSTVYILLLSFIFSGGSDGLSIMLQPKYMGNGEEIPPERSSSGGPGPRSGTRTFFDFVKM